MNVKGNHPLAEILACKLFSIETVPAKEQAKMVRIAIKAAVEFYEKNNKKLNPKQAKTDTCFDDCNKCEFAGGCKDFGRNTPEG